MINIESNTGIAKIELLDNPFVNDWKEHFITMLDNSDFRGSGGGTPWRMRSVQSSGRISYQYQYITYPYLYGSLEKNHKEVKKLIIKRSNELYKTINAITDMGITFPLTIDDINNEIEHLDLNNTDFMQLLNKIHRYCTTAVRVMRLNKSDGNTIELFWSDDDPYNSKFNVDYNDIEYFATLMEQGNLGVHRIDCCIPTPRKLKYLTNELKSDTLEIQFDFVEPEILDLTEDKKIFFKDIPPDYYQYASDSDDYDVWIAIDILGKNYQEAYFDYEDPREWDVTQPLGHSAGFHVNLSKPPATLQSLIRSDDMQNWFKEHNLNYKPHMNNYPLGNVVKGKEHLRHGTKHVPSIGFIKDSYKKTILQKYV